MKKLNYTVDMDWQGGQARLDHYNEWLMDPKRPIGEIYPGFPGDKNGSYSEVPEQEVRVLEVTVAPKPKKSHNRGTVTKHTHKGNQMAKVTNLSRATEIVKASASKAEALEKIVAELNVTRSNAFVYFTKATKALGSAGTEAAPKAEKTEKPAKVKTSKVTELSPEKAKAKVAEIDKVIAGLKANGAKVASPFAGLVA